MPLVRIVIGTYLKRNPDLMDVANRCDLSGIAEQAVCQAALTYNPDKAGISAYFTVAIHRALSKEIQARRNQTWLRSPSGSGAACSAGSGSLGCSTPRPPPTCSPG
jgi:hypothetical protein